MIYTNDYAHLDDAALKEARKIALNDARAAQAVLDAARKVRDGLELEAFRRLHAKKIDDAVLKIQENPLLLESSVHLRNNPGVRRLGVRTGGQSSQPYAAAWRMIIGVRHLAGWVQTASDRKMVEIVLAILDEGVAPEPARC